MSDSLPPVIPRAGTKAPETELKSAAQLFWLYSFFLALPIGIVVALSETKPDQLGVVLLCGSVLFLSLLITSGVLLFLKKRAGLYLGWVLVPFILLSFPIGTAVGVFIIMKITKPDVKALLT